MDEVQNNNTYCNIVFYNRVYHLDEFIPIHKGGAEAMERNCQKDATFVFENLQCISMVPDHFEGMIKMCNDYIVGVIKGSNEDPCANGDNILWTEPEYPYPDFTKCDVYHNITCTALDEDQVLSLPAETIAAIEDNDPSSPALTQRLWTLGDVEAAQSVWEVNFATNETEHCYTILHDWVYDLGTSPLDGSAPHSTRNTVTRCIRRKSFSGAERL